MGANGYQSGRILSFPNVTVKQFHYLTVVTTLQSAMWVSRYDTIIFYPLLHVGQVMLIYPLFRG